MNILLVLPNQLFEKLPLKTNIINKIDKVIIYEHPTFFTEFNYHKMKLLYHRVTMKRYQEHIIKKLKLDCEYIEFNNKLESKLGSKKNHFIFYDPVDHNIEKQLLKISKKFSQFTIIESKLFMEKRVILQEYTKNKKRFTHNNFYKWQRKRLNILMNKNKPEGGKWSFDNENREKFPPNFKKDIKIKMTDDKLTKESKKYIEKYFSKNFGDNNCYLPVTHSDSKKHFKKFLKERLNCFGPYQDAVDKNINFGCHSLISPMLNIGLLEVKYVVDETIKYYNKNKNTKNLLQSVEGFLRQIIGWRAYVRMIYLTKEKELKDTNFFKHKNKLSKHWYDGTLNIPPVDNIIDKLKETAYAHHIERLMYAGNLMLLMKIKPDDIYKWFMELFIDSYHWVMLPNVHGMSQHSAKNLMMTRPYFSSSNYIVTMSGYNKKKDNHKKIQFNNDHKYEWFEIWDALYYNFINTHYNYLSKNYSTSRSTNHWNNKSNSEQKKLLVLAKNYLNNY